MNAQLRQANAAIIAATTQPTGGDENFIKNIKELATPELGLFQKVDVPDETSPDQKVTYTVAAPNLNFASLMNVARNQKIPDKTAVDFGTSGLNDSIKLAKDGKTVANAYGQAKQFLADARATYGNEPIYGYGATLLQTITKSAATKGFNDLTPTQIQQSVNTVTNASTGSSWLNFSGTERLPSIDSILMKLPAGTTDAQKNITISAYNNLSTYLRDSSAEANKTGQKVSGINLTNEWKKSAGTTENIIYSMLYDDMEADGLIPPRQQN
jgi:hypothetical protein